MAISIFSKEDQASGNFNFGEIKEKKPIGFPQDGGSLLREPTEYRYRTKVHVNTCRLH